MSFITDGNATALIPQPIANEIIKMAAESSAAMQMFRTVNMGTKTQRLPVTTALASAYFVSGPTGSTAPGRKKTSSAAWERKTLTAEEIAVIIPIAEETLDDADFDIWAEVKPQIAEAIGAKVDGAVLFGVDKPTSWSDEAIVAAARAAGNSFVRGSVGSQRLDVDISDVMSLVEADGFAVNGHVADISLKGGLRGLRDADGQPIYIGSPREDVSDRPTVYSEPINFLKNGAWDGDEADLVTGDFTKAILGIRQDIRFKVLTEATIQDPDDGSILYNLAQNDMVAIRATFRCAYVTANPVTRLAASAGSRFPFAVLRPAGASA